MLFATATGQYEYITHNKVAPRHWQSEGVAVLKLNDDTAKITATFTEPGAKIVFFGAE